MYRLKRIKMNRLEEKTTILGYILKANRNVMLSELREELGLDFLLFELKTEIYKKKSQERTVLTEQVFNVGLHYGGVQ